MVVPAPGKKNLVGQLKENKYNFTSLLCVKYDLERKHVLGFCFSPQLCVK